MSDLLRRAEVLFEQERWEQALEAYQSYLLENSEDAHALVMVARCFTELELFGKASEYAQAAIAVMPDYAYAHYIQAHIYSLRNLDSDAHRALSVALELEPTNASFHVLQSGLHANQSDWLAAKRSAETALGFEPHLSEGLVALANALVHLNSIDEAEEALTSVLEADPESESALCQMGMLNLHRSSWERALEFFERALAIDPENKVARYGFMQALRARYPIYGMILRYFLWMNKFSRKYQQGIQYGLSLAARLLSQLRQQYPVLAPLITLVLVLWRVFAYLSWTIKAATTLLLRMNEHGRRLVDKDEIMESNIVGVLWAAALGCWLYHTFVDPFTMFCRVGIGVFLTLPVVVGGAFGTTSDGWPKWVARGLMGAMLFSGIVGLFLFTWGVPLGLTLVKFYINSLGIVILLLALLEGIETRKD